MIPVFLDTFRGLFPEKSCAKGYGHLGGSIIPATLHEKGFHDTRMAYKVTVEDRRCNGCEECLEACTVGMFRMQNGRALPVEGKECMGCQSCVAVCDKNAIVVADTRVALSGTFLSLMGALDEMDTETEISGTTANTR